MPKAATQAYKARIAQAKKAAQGEQAQTDDKELNELLPFIPIPKDKDYNTKLCVAHCMRLFPHKIDTRDCLNLFRKHFQRSLTSLDDEGAVIDFITPYLLRHFRALKPKPFVRKNLALLQECFGLSELEVQTLYVLYIFDSIGTYYDGRLDYFETCALIGEILQASHRQISSLLRNDKPLRQLGFIDMKDRYRGLEPEGIVERIMNESFSKDEMMKSLARIYPPSQLTRHDFSYMQKELDTLIEYFAKSKSPSIFLYGAPGVGKNEIAALLAKELGRELWEIYNIDEQGRANEDRTGQFIRAQKMFDRDKTILLLDECEDIFPSTHPRVFYEDKADKNTINKMLESIRVPSILLSNSACIDAAFLRRFDIVLEVKAPPKHKKQELVSRALSTQNIKLDSHIIKQLSESSLSQGVLLKACKVAKTLALKQPRDSKGRDSKPKARQDSIKESFLRLINEHLKLQGQKTISLSKPHTLPYDMSLINASVDMRALSERIKSALDSSVAESSAPQGVRILAHGIAGSGKSEFAKALAKELDKPLLLKKASDLLSMWVGGSEQNIAHAFSEASRQEAILVLDEVDSFLQERSGASASYEITQVNEMLTQMESFSGIFIATTNLIENLDRASIRRFDIKVEFKPLDSARLARAFVMYGEYLGVRECAAFVESSEGKRALEGLENICFGDFALLSRSARFAPIESAKSLLEQLKSESKLKSKHAGKRVGF